MPVGMIALISVKEVPANFLFLSVEGLERLPLNGPCPHVLLPQAPCGQDRPRPTALGPGVGAGCCHAAQAPRQ
jgi:hypothetical protein